MKTSWQIRRFEPRKWLLILMLRFFFFRIHQGAKGDIQLPRVTGDTFQDQRPAVERPGKSRRYLGRESRKSRCFVCFHRKISPLTWEMFNIPACGRQTYSILLWSIGFYWDLDEAWWSCFMSYGQNLVNGEGTSLSRVGPYRFCGGGTLGKLSWGYRFGYCFRVCPYRFCSDANPRALSILLWSYLILSDTHIFKRRRLKESNKSNKCWDLLRYSWVRLYQMVQGMANGPTNEEFLQDCVFSVVYVILLVFLEPVWCACIISHMLFLQKCFEMFGSYHGMISNISCGLPNFWSGGWSPYPYIAAV